MARREYYCDKHPLTLLICPRCQGAKGGRKTAHTHSHEELQGWGKQGGRPKKKRRRKAKKKA